MRKPTIVDSLRACALLSVGVFVAACVSFNAPGAIVETFPLTVAEHSGFTETGRHAEVLAFMRELDAQSDLLHLTSLGETFEGRAIPLAIIADPPVTSAAQARADDRLTVLLFGNIHAGEVCGKEALQMLARELIQGRNHPLLDDLIIAIVPIYNADGNERFSPDNRPGQVGPIEMGQRPNAQGFDLNRDWIKLDAPETRAMVRFLREWDPIVIVDTHTTNGSLHQYTVTYESPLDPAGDQEIVEFARDTMMPSVRNDLFDDTGYRSEVYGNFDRQHTVWYPHPGQPRFGTVYRGMRNRIGILSEAYSYATFEDRVRGTLGFCKSILEYSAEHKDDLRSLIERVDARTVEAGRQPLFYDKIAVRRDVRAYRDKITILGYEEIREEGQRPQPGKPREYDVDFLHDFYGTRFVNRPFAYVIPAELDGVIGNLEVHGVEMHRMTSEQTIQAEWYVVDEIQRAERAFQQHNIVSVEATAGNGEITIPSGSVIVYTAQPLGSLACYLLEPEAADGLVAWNFLDQHLSEGEQYPILRLLAPVEIPTEPLGD